MELLKQVEQEVAQGQVTEYKETEAKLTELEATYGTEVPNCSTKDGYDRSKSIASEMTKLRTSLESKRKEYKSPVLALGKLIDSEAKKITERIKAIEEPHKLAYRAIDEDKKRIKLAIEEKFVWVKSLPSAAIESETSDQVEDIICKLAETDISEDTFGKRSDEASALIASTLERLSGIHAQKVEDEIEQEKIKQERAELEALRKQQEEREEAERKVQEQAEQAKREAEIAEQAAKEAKAQEELRQKEEIERIENEKQEALEREKKAKLLAEKAEARRIKEAEEAEQLRIYAEAKAKRDAELAAERAKQKQIEAQKAEDERIKAEQSKREANNRHAGKIRKQAKESLMAIGLDEDKSREIVLAISNGNIANVQINY